MKHLNHKPKTQMETPIKIENRAGKVRLNDIVTKGLIDPLMDQICTLYGSEEIRNDAGEGEALDILEIEIDSQGGSVAEGYRLYKTIIALRERGVEVVANVTDLAASMGSVIAMAASKVRMAENSRLMIHEASTSLRGDADKMHHVAGYLENISQEIAGIYSARTGHPVDVIRDAMKRETWLSAEACVQLGFADETYAVEQKPYNPSILERMIGNNAGKEIDTNATKLHYGDRQPETMSILSNLKPDAALVAKLKVAEDDILDANASLVAKDSEISLLKTELIESSNEKAGLIEAATGHAVELSTVTAELDQTKKDLSTALAEWGETETRLKAELSASEAKSTPEAIQAAVTDELAKCGHQPIKTGTATSEESTENLTGLAKAIALHKSK